MREEDVEKLIAMIDPLNQGFLKYYNLLKLIFNNSNKI